MPDQSCVGLSVYAVTLERAMQRDVLDTIRRDVAAGKVVILQGAAELKRALELRDLVVAWRSRIEVVEFSVDTNIPDINFHRIDADPAKSQLPHRFHQHGFGAPDDLGETLKQSLLGIAKPMLALQNAIADTDYDLAMPEVRMKVLQYPRGGGFLAKHSHPIRPQGVGLILALSEIGKDFCYGGTTFGTPMGNVDTSKLQNAGDLILFRYDLEHAVKPIDDDVSLDWGADTGRWTLVLELITTHGRSEAA